MELDEILSPWMKQLESAAFPYLQFVTAATQAISELEVQVDELLKAQAEVEIDPFADSSSTADLTSFTFDSSATLAPSPSAFAPAIQGIEPEKFHALERELSDQVLVRKSQQSKIEELQSQITVLKAALSEAEREAEVATENAARVVSEYAQKSARAEMSEKTSSDKTPREPRQTTPKISFPERHVLLIDDAEINRVLMSHYFKGLPVKLEFAVSVEVALTKCKERKFDLIVIDDELKDLENPGLRASSGNVVGLSNHVSPAANPAHFQHVLSRGQERQAFIEKLKSFLWSA